MLHQPSRAACGSRAWGLRQRACPYRPCTPGRGSQDCFPFWLSPERRRNPTPHQNTPQDPTAALCALPAHAPHTCTHLVAISKRPLWGKAAPRQCLPSPFGGSPQHTVLTVVPLEPPEAPLPFAAPSLMVFSEAEAGLCLSCLVIAVSRPLRHSCTSSRNEGVYSP